MELIGVEVSPANLSKFKINYDVFVLDFLCLDYKHVFFKFLSFCGKQLFGELTSFHLFSAMVFGKICY